MGVAVPLAIGAHLRRLQRAGTPNPRRRILMDASWRGAKLFFIGLVLITLGGRNDLEKLRIFGVLQRLGICYVVATAFFLPAARTKYPDPPVAPVGIVQLLIFNTFLRNHYLDVYSQESVVLLCLVFFPAGT